MSTIRTVQATRRTALVVVMAVAVVAGAGGVGAAGLIRSPDDVARASAPPEPTLLTAPVERRVLTSSIVTRGNVRLSESTAVSVDSGLGGETAAGGGVVITGKVPAEGASLSEGAVAIEISGRPVFLLSGALPMYRSLRPGMSGADVLQLEQALARLGFLAAPDSAYDAATSAAVTAWYRGNGYEPVLPSEDEAARLDAARTQAASARAARRQAQSARDQAAAPPRPSAVRNAEAAVSAARAQVEASRAEREDAVREAEPGERDRVRREHDVRVAQAEQQLASAEAALDELTAPKDTSALDGALAEATAALADAERSLAELLANSGPRVPRGELVFVPTLPRKAQGVKAVVGEKPESQLLTLAGGDPQIEAEVVGVNASRVRPGANAIVSDPSLGHDVTAEVVFVAERPGTDGASPGMHRVRVRPVDGDLASAAGLNVRLTVPLDSTSGPVLAVPAAALFTTEDRSVHVQALRDGVVVDVEVRTGLAAGGLVEVVPKGRLAEGDRVVLGLRG